MSKSVLESTATNVLADLGGKRQRAFDPAMIFTILDIFTQILERCQNRTAQQFKDAADNPTPLQRLAVRRQVKDVLTRAEWFDFGTDLVDTVIAKGGKLTTAEWEAAIAEARSI